MESSNDNTKRLESSVNLRNPKWLSSNVKEMDRNTAHMLNLIDGDEDSFARRADLYYKRRPELIDQVHKLQHMYRTLAKQYEQLIVDLHPPVASDLESESSTSRAVPDSRLNRYRSSRAAGFDYFLRCNSERSREVSPGPDFEERSVSSVHSSPRVSVSHSEEALNEKTIQIDSEQYNGKEQTEIPQQENVGLLELQLKVAGYEVEIAKLKTELETVRSLNSTNLQGEGELSLNNNSEMDVKPMQEVEEDSRSTDITASDTERVRTMSKEVNEKLTTENKLARELIQKLQDKIKDFKEAEKDLKSQLDRVTRKVLKRDDKISELAGSLIEIRKLIADPDKKSPLHAELSRLKTEKDQVEMKHRELELHCQTLKDELLKAGTENREQLEALKSYLDELKLKYDSLMSERDELIAEAGSSNELKVRVGELQEEVERLRVLISETEEEKREAIRQLCFSLEHYRKGYKQLRRVTTEHVVLPALLAS